MDAVSKGQPLTNQLMAAADEPGISRESVAQAESEYREETLRARELAAYNREKKRIFHMHLGIYAAVNAFLLIVNLVSWEEDPSPWFMFPAMGWGIGT